MLKKTVALLLCCASWSWTEMCWNHTAEGIRQEIACDQTAQHVSTDVAPQSGLPAWQDPGVHVVDIESLATADAHHPASCAKTCVWTGARCICNENPLAAKKP